MYFYVFYQWRVLAFFFHWLHKTDGAYLFLFLSTIYCAHEKRQSQKHASNRWILIFKPLDSLIPKKASTNNDKRNHIEAAFCNVSACCFSVDSSFFIFLHVVQLLFFLLLYNWWCFTCVSNKFLLEIGHWVGDRNVNLSSESKWLPLKILSAIQLVNLWLESDCSLVDSIK